MSAVAIPIAGPPLAAPASGTEILAAELSPLCGGRVSTADLDRLACARDMWPRWLILEREGRWPPPPDLVASPGTTSEVAALVRRCRDLSVPVVPYGAGSGVCGGTAFTNGGVALDLKRLSRVRRIDRTRREVEVEAGHLGWTLEERLGRERLTIGHFPSSMSCSTVGGWMAARGAGQLSTRYGKIEDLCLGIEAVLPDGEVIDERAALGGSPWVDLLCGSEGTLAVLTAGTFRLRPQAARRRFAACEMEGVEKGLAAVRALLRAGLTPAVVRLYDPLDTLLASGGDRGSASAEARTRAPPDGWPEKWRTLSKRLGLEALGASLRVSWFLNRAVDLMVRGSCRLVLVFEGAAGECEVQVREAERLLGGLGARPLGAGPAERWWEHRYDVSFRQSALFAAGLWVDTLELSARWERLTGLYQAVRRALAPYALCMAHFSHAYVEGCSIYVTFAGGGRNADERAARHRDAWAAALAAALGEGVSVSHHHGVGLAKADAYRRQLGTAGLSVLQALKDAFDPTGVLNPGKLGLAARKASPVPAASRRSRARAVRPASAADLVATLEEGARVQKRRGFDGIDRSALDQIGPLNDESALVDVGAGRRIGGLESRLRSSRLTLGPLTPAVLAGTVAEWVEGPHRSLRATEGGRLESAVFSLEVALPDGSIFRTPAVPRSAAGPGLESAFLGGRAHSGLLLSATLRVLPAPGGRRRVTARARSSEALVEALRMAMDDDAVPTAAGLRREGRSVVLAVAFDLPEPLAEVRATRFVEAVQAAGAVLGKAAAANHWWSGRAEAAGLEIAVAWGDLPRLLGHWEGRCELYRLTHEGVVAVGRAQPPPRGY
ncbi:MAG TPA: FAD-binding protein, partial [Myxococcales bacterium]|nr:FAD-binding protein [Myxococcales bacterium]